AHDIKNPLSSILLTLQRLQMEYRDHDKSRSNVYDRYTERIIERIDSLRRMSRGFMKFLNLEKLNPQPINVNELIENLFTSSIVVLPKDIQLEKNMLCNYPLPIWIKSKYKQC
ncbi:MAG: histidine kinase dimerization/phospho-acceptor domain-containing protein, partial [bacterium]